MQKNVVAALKFLALDLQVGGTSLSCPWNPSCQYKVIYSGVQKKKTIV